MPCPQATVLLLSRLSQKAHTVPHSLIPHSWSSVFFVYYFKFELWIIFSLPSIICPSPTWPIPTTVPMMSFLLNSPVTKISVPGKCNHNVIISAYRAYSWMDKYLCFSGLLNFFFKLVITINLLKKNKVMLLLITLIRKQLVMLMFFTFLCLMISSLCIYQRTKVFFKISNIFINNIS